MEKINFKLTINAPKEKVWYSLWDDENYKAWTSVFYEGSYAISSFEKGHKIFFVAPIGDGMSSIVEENKPFEAMSFKHMLLVKNFEEQPIDEETKLWSGCIERYDLSENNNQTTLLVTLDISESHLEYFNETFPKALQKVKEIAENPEVKSITVRALVDASVEKVWDYWTNPEHIVNWNNASDDWHTPFAENDLKVGGKFKATMAAKDGSMSFDFEGTYTEVEPHKKIVYNIADGRKVSIGFDIMDGKVIITESFEPESENSLDLQRGGWQAILNNFKAYVEK